MLAAVAAALAVLPGLLTWAWGRRLVRSSDDPALPERVLAWRHRSIVAFAVSAALLVVLLPRQAPWSVPLLVFSQLAGGFPIRRALFGESWDLIAYLAHLVRLTLGVVGFWLLLLVAPALVAWAGLHRWPVAAILALLLVAWGLAYPHVLLWVMRATPLEQPELAARFDAIAERSTAPRPRVWLAGPREGRWANAFALPATQKPGVVLTRTLLEAFDQDELAAIFAHEQAHLEHFDARRVRRLAAVQTVAVLAGTLGAAAVLERFAGASLAITLGWPLLVLAAAFLRMVRHRAHETESDRRAVELCGDPRALVRALVKLHALALMPRRLAVEEEQRATHPSLANRLRAIEELAPAAEPSLADEEGLPSSQAEAGPLPTVLAGVAPGDWVLLGTQQAHWLEGVPEGTPRDHESLRAGALRVRSFAYSELVELRLRPRGRDHVLAASDRTGAAWSMPLASGEAAPAHEALDAVDRRLAPPSAARSERKVLGALVACAGALMAVLAWSAAALPALLAVVLTHPGPLAAFGASALAAALLALATGVGPGPALDPELAPLVMLGLGLCGAAALWIARTTAWREAAGRTRTAPWVALALALPALVLLVLPGLGLATGGLLRGHIAARDHPGGAVLLIAAMASLLVVPRRWARGTAMVLGSLAAVALILGAPLVASRWVRDPFFAPGATSEASRTLTLELIDEQALPATTGQLELSPSGATWAIRQFDLGAGDQLPVSQMIVGSKHGPHYPYGASELVLLDDARLLALFQDGDYPAVELRPHDPEEPPLWRAELEPLLGGASLAADPATGRWRVSGTHPETGAFVRVSGEGDGSLAVEQWGPGAEGAVWVAGDGPAALGIAPRADGLLESGDPDLDSPPLWWLLSGYAGVGFGGRVLSLDATGAHELYESQLHLQCDAAPPGAGPPLCWASDGSRTTLWRVDPVDGGRSPRGRVEGVVWSARPQPGGWLLLASAGPGQRLYRLESDRLVRLDVGGTPPWIQAVAGHPGGVGLVVSDEGHQSLLRRFALP